MIPPLSWLALAVTLAAVLPWAFLSMTVTSVYGFAWLGQAWSWGVPRAFLVPIPCWAVNQRAFTHWLIQPSSELSEQRNNLHPTPHPTPPHPTPSTLGEEAQALKVNVFLKVTH